MEKHRVFGAVLAVAAIVTMGSILSSTASAAVMGIDNATFDPGPPADSEDNEADQTLTSFDYDGETYTDLYGTTSADVTGTGGHFYATGGTNPVTDNAAAASGLVVTTGVANPSRADFMFDVAASGSDVLFIWELATTSDSQGVDGMTVQPLDSDGAVIGDWTLDIHGDDEGTTDFVKDWGPGFLPTNFNGPVPDGFMIVGVAFQLSDFTGTGTLTGVQGLRLNDNDDLDDGDNGSNMDPTLVGFAIPEPATMSLLAIGGLAMGLRRRRR